MRIEVPYNSMTWLYHVPGVIILLGVFVGGYFVTTSFNIDGAFLSVLITLALFAVGATIYNYLYKWLRRVSAKKMTLTLDDQHFEADGPHKINVSFSQSYMAMVDAGASIAGDANGAIKFYDKKNPFFIGAEGADRGFFTKQFSNKWFVGFSPVTQLGARLDVNDPEHHAFLKTLFERLEQTKEQNQIWQSFKQFPWETRPNPRVSEPTTVQKAEAETSSLVQGIKQDAIWSGEGFVWITTGELMIFKKDRYEVYPLNQILLEIQPRNYRIAGLTALPDADILSREGHAKLGETLWRNQLRAEVSDFDWLHAQRFINRSFE